MSCSNCKHLDKSKKREVSKCFQYGCKIHGYITTWVNSDAILDTTRCSEDSNPEPLQMNLFDLLVQKKGANDE